MTAVFTGYQKYKMCLSKVRYRDYNTAKRQCKKYMRRRGTTLKVYKCPICQGYHLTKHTPQEKVNDQ